MLQQGPEPDRPSGASSSILRGGRFGDHPQDEGSDRRVRGFLAPQPQLLPAASRGKGSGTLRNFVMYCVAAKPDRQNLRFGRRHGALMSAIDRACSQPCRQDQRRQGSHLSGKGHVHAHLACPHRRCQTDRPHPARPDVRARRLVEDRRLCRDAGNIWQCRRARHRCCRSSSSPS